VLEPPLSPLPLTVLEQSSRHYPPQRMHALKKTAAFWEQVVRNMAGTVRMMGRTMPPAWSLVLTGLPQLST
jgi:hypothetical protein